MRSEGSGRTEGKLPAQEKSEIYFSTIKRYLNAGARFWIGFRNWKMPSRMRVLRGLRWKREWQI